MQAEHVPGSRLSGEDFTRFWISYSQGTITVGLGKPGLSSPHYSWTDPQPIPDLKHIGLSTWDKHVGYRHIHMQPAVDLQSKVFQQQPQAPSFATGPQSLKALCRHSIEQHLTPQNLCSILYGVEVLAPALDELREPLLDCLADNLEDAAQLDHDHFCQLPCSCLMTLLERPGLVSPVQALHQFNSGASKGTHCSCQQHCYLQAVMQCLFDWDAALLP